MEREAPAGWPKASELVDRALELLQIGIHLGHLHGLQLGQRAFGGRQGHGRRGAGETRLEGRQLVVDIVAALQGRELALQIGAGQLDFPLFRSAVLPPSPTTQHTAPAAAVI